MSKVLFVCMGNICRSPTAEGVFRHLLKQQKMEHLVEADSAGTHAYHVGDPPDQRAQRAALKRGVDLSVLRARRVAVVDFERFDYILAMDEENIQALHEMSPPHLTHKVELLMKYAPDVAVEEVPDPYYGGTAGFERVLDMVEAAANGLLNHIRNKQM